MSRHLRLLSRDHLAALLALAASLAPIGAAAERPGAAGGREMTTDRLDATESPFGLTRQLGPDLKVDLGFNLGVSRTAADRVFFAGFARRF